MYTKSVVGTYTCPVWTRRARFINVFFLSFACIALVGEFVLPLWANWDLPVSRHSSEDEVRLLLVADPHVQLYHTYWYYGEYFALMDSDRYLRRYFRRVRRLTEPDAILILGDLVDGDNNVSNDIFLHAAERVKQMFISSHSTPCFMIPGDNDIGGEGDDPITDQRTERFKRVFGLLSNSQNIRFVHLHGNTPWNVLTKPVNLNDAHVTILLSHIPDISSQAITDLEPDILISGHDHMASVCRWEQQAGAWRKKQWLIPPDRLQLPTGTFELRLDSTLERRNNKTLVQLGVPSCSCRSGQPHLSAYGLLQVYRNRTIRFTLFKLPNRFHILCAYLFLLTIFLIYIISCLQLKSAVRAIFVCCTTFGSIYFITELLD
ncbi:hypothetical protein EG68_11722 [Paragonimus skrjabini miyazakii]|uniref:Calcineurin-like phosphoesterase domain-containing protein n=1 Tax=Paragonimus skrjabini miyazakii TaxID=59628 RepID=A0A8S9YFW8_9TREM|nr:hypothetical protein EG68_11722 [Paragonimus skrjabini miyazakii]